MAESQTRQGNKKRRQIGMEKAYGREANKVLGKPQKGSTFGPYFFCVS